MRIRRRTRTRPPYKLLSVLLQYPDPSIIEAEAEILAAVDALPPSPYREALGQFCAACTALSPVERAQQYVSTFDLAKRASLYLTYYAEGDKRQRGTELVRLKRLYAAGGMVMESGGELPDFLPMMLEFAEFAQAGYGETVLAGYRPALEVLRARLRELKSPYAYLLDAVCDSLPALTIPQMSQVRRLIAEGPPTEHVGLEPYAPPEVMPVVGARR